MDLVNLINLSLSSESSSESSSSGEEEFMYLLNAATAILPTRNKRTTVLRYCELTIPLYSDKEFITHFRLSRNVAYKIIEEFERSPLYKNISEDRGLAKVSASKHVLTFLWFVGHECASYRDVADRFDVSLSTLFHIISRVSKYLCELPMINWPNALEAEETKRHYLERKGFPRIIGIIDGTHIRINRPKADPDSYLNRKQFHSIQVQLVCNEANLILDVFIGYPGSAHDARVFRNSTLFNKPPADFYGGYLIGDSAYPCLTNLLVPYKDFGNLNRQQKLYNKKLSSCRVTIEHTNGLLKQRFRQLYHLNLKNISRICHIIKACCILHNMASSLDHDIFAEEQFPAEHIGEEIYRGELVENGVHLRNEIANAL